MTVYVVAIAATNFASAYDWLIEDFGVSKVVDFTKYDPANPTAAASISSGTPYISMATAIGVGRLLANMPSPTGAVAAGTSLQTFLQSIKPDQPATVIFTGHSLAGALSPTTAFYLNKNANALSAFTEVLAYPTAGATPGDSSFASAFTTALSSSTPGTLPYQRWNTDLWNFYDVVPHAWQRDILAEVTTLYGNAAAPHPFDQSKPPFLVDIWAIVQYALHHSSTSQSGVTYTRIPNLPLNNAQPSSVQPCTSLIPGPSGTGASGSPVSVPPNTDQDFILQLVTQHVNMYSGIPEVTYFPTPTSPLATQPAVPGLILPQPLPQLSPPPSLLPGIAKAPDSTILKNIEAWILKAAAEWLKHHLP